MSELDCKSKTTGITQNKNMQSYYTYGGVTDIEFLESLEKSSKNHLKIPLKKDSNFDNLNVNRSDALG